MDIDNVSLFKTIAMLGTLSAAARQLGLPAMTVSRRLASLEDELGVRLFHRTTRSVSLTPEGEAFLPYATTLLETHDAALAAMVTGDSGLRGVLKVTAPNLIGRSLIVPALTRLMADNPSLKVDLTLTDGIVDIVDSGLDLAIRVSPLESSELVATQLAPNPRILCAAPDYIRRFGKPATTEDLVAHPCLTLHGMPAWPLEVEGETRMVRVTGPFATSSVEAVRAVCIEGAGIAMMTYWDVWQCLEDGSLERIELSDATLGGLGIWAVYATRRRLPERVRVLMDQLRAQLQERVR
ncbi:LysR family transcriptional regulator [Paracoccus sp. PAR01]|uniref:LysR family transcriptional regulator n=1 Tax=Paracoccus sp. PAR01 TaxID=2769282 RepID=UPI00177DADE1|nr:LysR family transcriptional regulator [Paracoccus sp. PAR01]MBD9529067.1 LysR family transcriptional regulator [Paracoccus sp. PAR01]